MGQLQVDRELRRRPCADVRARRSATRFRAVLPVLAAPFAICAAALLALAGGLSTPAVVATTAAVALGGALIAHRTVSSVLAGLLLLLARPYAPGERLRLYVPELGTSAEAEIIRTGLVTSTLCTDGALLVVPNRRLLRG